MENAKKVWYYEKWVGRHASFPPIRSVKLNKRFHISLFLSVQQEDDHNPETKDENDEDDSDHKVDLDTRLKMLMKGKANMPSFLLNELNGSEEDDEEDEEDGKNFLTIIFDEFNDEFFDEFIDEFFDEFFDEVFDELLTKNFICNFR